jgi:hypothetical protein
MVGFKSLMISMVLVGLFVFATINFGIIFASENDSNQSIGDHPSIANLSIGVNDSLRGFDDDISGGKSSFISDIPVIGDSLVILAAASVWKTFVTLPKVMFDLTFGTISEVIFGNGAGGFGLVFIVIGSIVVAVLIFYAWKWIRSGDPD